MQLLWKTVWKLLKKPKIELPYHLAVSLLGLHPEKTTIPKDTGNTVFIAAMFITARTQKKPRCPSTEVWINKDVVLYKMEYYLAIKKNEIGSFVETWVNLETYI